MAKFRNRMGGIFPLSQNIAKKGFVVFAVLEGACRSYLITKRLLLQELVILIPSLVHCLVLLILPNGNRTSCKALTSSWQKDWRGF